MNKIKNIILEYKTFFLVIFSLFVVFIGVCCMVFSVIHLLDNKSTAYFLALTDSAYEYDVFFDPQKEDICVVYSKNCLIGEDYHFEFIDYYKHQSENNNYDFSEFIKKNKEEILKHAENDEFYNQYLDDKHLNIEKLSEYMDKYANVSDDIMRFSFYIVLTLFWLLTVHKLKFRTEFYIVTGVIYAILTLSSFSDGILDYYLVNLCKTIDKTIGYGTIPDTKLMYETCRESMMTYIIFDTIIPTIHEKAKYKKVRKEFTYLSNVLPANYLFLQSVQKTADQDFILRLKFDSSVISKLCESELDIIDKKKNKLNKKKQKLEDELNDLESNKIVLKSLQKDAEIFSGKAPYKIDTYVKAMNGLIIEIRKVSDILKLSL